MATPTTRSVTDGIASSPLNKAPNSPGAIARGEDSGVPSARKRSYWRSRARCLPPTSPSWWRRCAWPTTW